jgi:hypothetical protein
VPEFGVRKLCTMTLTKAHETSLCVGLVRTGYHPDDFDGVIQKLSSSWCLVASLDSLDPDGYWIIRRDTIRNVRYTRIEAFRLRHAIPCPRRSTSRSSGQ